MHKIYYIISNGGFLGIVKFPNEGSAEERNRSGSWQRQPRRKGIVMIYVDMCIGSMRRQSHLESAELEKVGYLVERERGIFLRWPSPDNG